MLLRPEPLSSSLRRDTHSGHPVLFVTFLLLALLAAFLAHPGPVAAHAELVRADPPADGLLAVPPRGIDLWFSEEVASGGGSPSLRLLDQGGRDLSVADVGVDPSDLRHVTASVGGIAPGTVTVVWSVRSATDGHRLDGTFAFRVGTGRAPGAATLEGETPRAWAVVSRWLTFLGLALAVGGLAFGLVLTRTAAEREVAADVRTKAIIGGTLLALLATMAEPLLQAEWPPTGTVSPSLCEAIAGLPRAWWLRPAATGAMLVLFALSRPLGRANRARIALVALVLALFALLGLSLTSHAAGRSEWRLPAVAANVLHQWSVALWVGGLIHLALWWAGRGRAPTPVAESDLLVRRFSRWALGLVAVGVATGVVNAGFVLPELASLWNSRYGQVLLLKVVVLVIPLTLATFHRAALRRTLGPLSAVFRRTLRVEAAFVVLVIMGGSLLATLAPPTLGVARSTRLDVAEPAIGRPGGESLMVHLLLTPARPGQNEAAIRFTNRDQSPVTGKAPALVRLVFTNLEHPVTTNPLEARPQADGSFAAEGVQLGLEGWWRAEVTLRWLGEPDVVVPYYLLLPDPNVHGEDAPPDRTSDPAAEAVFQRGMAGYTGMHRVRYRQTMANNTGTGSYSEHTVNDGEDGQLPGLYYRVPGGMEAIVLGETNWLRRKPDGPWEEFKGNSIIPPSAWDEEYADATGFRLGRIEEIDGEACQIVTFATPQTQGRVMTWYSWWVDTETGLVRRMAMVSRAHYMTNDYADFDAPLPIEPPAEVQA